MEERDMSLMSTAAPRRMKSRLLARLKRSFVSAWFDPSPMIVGVTTSQHHASSHPSFHFPTLPIAASYPLSS